METPEANRPSRLETLSEEMRARIGEVGSARRLQHTGGATPAETAKSKLQGYRNRSIAVRAYNRSTERLIDTAQGQTLAPLPADVANGNGNASPDWSPTSAIAATTDLRMDSAVYSSRTDNALSRLTRVNRTLQAKVKMLEEENERYRRDVNGLGVQVDGITDESMTTDQNVANLMDDLQMEKNNHYNAQQSLEQKCREIDAIRRDLGERTADVEARDLEARQARADLTSRTERLEVKTHKIQQKDLELQEQAARLSELEHESREAHHKNVELTARIQELMERREDGVSVGDAVRSMEGGTGEGEAGEEGDAEAAAEKEALLKKLKRLEASVELKARQLETVTARADRACRELQRYKGTASRGGFMRALKALWSLLLTVGWVGFIGFVYVLVSEDALRPRGIDVYRFAT